MMPEPDSASPVGGWVSRQNALRVLVSALVASVILDVVTGWVTLTDSGIRNGYGDARGWYYALSWNIGDLTTWALLALAVIPVMTPGVLTSGAARCLRWWGVVTALYVAVLFAASTYYRILGPVDADVPRRTTVSVAMAREVPAALIALAAALVWLGEDRVRFTRRPRSTNDASVEKNEGSVEPLPGDADMIDESGLAP